MDILLKRLSEHFDATASIDQLIRSLEPNPEGDPPDDQNVNDTPIIEQLPIIKNILRDSSIREHLMEICNQCRMARESEVFDNTNDNWEYFTTIIRAESFLCYFYCIVELCYVNTNNATYCRLSSLAGRTYLLMLTSPGAKAFGVFHIGLIQKIVQMPGHILNVYHKNKKLYNNLNEFQLDFISILEDLQLLLKHVTFEDYDGLKKELIVGLVKIMEFNYETGFRCKYAHHLQDKCYRVLDDICLPIQGNISDSLLYILNGTGTLNRHSVAAIPPNSIFKIGSISDWFLDMLSKNPDKTVTILKQFIEAILTNSTLSAGDQFNRNLEICVKYDTAMFTMCNESILPFLKDFSCSTETVHRCNCVEIIGKMLLIDVICDWTIFRDKISSIPREIDLLSMLIDKLNDVNNTVKTKAMSVFLRVTTNGNKKVKEILNILLMKPVKNPVINRTKSSNLNETFNGSRDTLEEMANQSSSVSQCDNTDHCIDADEKDDIINDLVENIENTSTEESPIPGIDQFKDIKSKLFQIVKLNLKNKSALVRKSSLIFLECIAASTIDIDDYLTSLEFLSLRADSSTMVRRQLILSIDNILNKDRDNKNVLNTYITITLGLGNDPEPKVVEMVMESLKRNIFDNIVPYERSSSQQQLFPWKLLQTMLCSRSTPDLRGCIHKWIGSNLITPKTLSNIETYINTSNSTVAWILLSMIASKIKSKHPEKAVAELFKNLKFDLANSEDNSYMQLEVIACWLDDLSSASKNELFNKLSNLILSGGVAPRHIQRTYELCSRIIMESSSDEEMQWTRKVHDRSLQYILTHQKTLVISDLYNVQLISYIYIYSETITDLPEKVNTEIIKFFLQYLNDVINGKIKVQNDETLSGKINCIQNVLTRFALFSYDISSQVSPVIGKLLSKVNNKDIIITSMKCLGDLCKKRTAIAESILPYFLEKTQHRYSSVRETAIECVASLIMEDYLKFRGSLLMYVLAAILDPIDEINQLAIEILLKFTLEKNLLLMVNCLFESPFAFNGYTHFNNFAMFPTVELVLKSPLIGDEKRHGRELIYRFFIHYIDNIYCYLYFEHIHMILDQLNNEPLMRSPEARESIKDFLFICTEICVLKEKQKVNVANRDDAEDEPSIDVVPETVESNKKANGEQMNSRKKGPTIEKALLVVDKSIPVIYELSEKLIELDSSFSKNIDCFCEALCIHFDNFTEYAMPEQFWDKYRKKVPKKKITKPSDQNHRDNECEESRTRIIGNKENSKSKCNSEKSETLSVSTRTQVPCSSSIVDDSDEEEIIRPVKRKMSSRR